jgi:hypothetical protein
MERRIEEGRKERRGGRDSNIWVVVEMVPGDMDMKVFSNRKLILREGKAGLSAGNSPGVGLNDHYYIDLTPPILLEVVLVVQVEVAGSGGI